MNSMFFWDQSFKGIVEHSSIAKQALLLQVEFRPPEITVQEWDFFRSKMRYLSLPSRLDGSSNRNWL